MEISIDEGTAASAFSAFYAAAGEVAAGPPPTAEAEETKPPNYHQSIFPERSQVRIEWIGMGLTLIAAF